MKLVFSKPKLSKSSVKLDKNQSTILGVVATATMITIFCLTSSRVLLGQAMYQRRVINARNASTKQINDNIKAADNLIGQYNSVFIGSSSQNIIGGSNTSDNNAVPPDGDNGKIVLDALPTTYDFPALLTSLSKVLNIDGVGSPSIGGSDQAITINTTPSYNTQPANIDLTVSGATTYDSAVKVITDLEKSIRPFNITHLTLDGNEKNLSISMNLTTYYQPAKTLSIPSKEIK